MTTPSPSSTTNPWPERALLALVLGATLLLAWEHRHFAAERPTAAWIALARSGSAAPATFGVIYAWDRRILEVVYAGRETEELEGLARWPVVTIDAPRIGDRFDSPEALKAWILSTPRDVRFWLGLPRFLRAAREAVSPSVSWYETCLVALELYRLKPEAIRPAWLPPAPEDRRLLGLLLSPGPAAAREDAPLGDRRPAVTVEILNASGEGGVALQATKLLRLRQADVIDYRNAAALAERTAILDRACDYGAAAQVRRALGCGRDVEIVTRPEPGWHAAVTLVLGRDYRACAALGGDQQHGTR